MVQQLLLLGQVLVVALIYIFVWRVVAAARRDLVDRGRAAVLSPEAQDSTIVPAADALRARREAGLGDPRLVVQESEVLRPGVPFTIGGGLTIGRAADNDVVLDEAIVSGRHLRVVPPGTVVDAGSTNGTLVNGRRVDGRAALRAGDQLQVGTTVFRYEVPR